MKILFLTTAYNSLSQRAFVELVDRGHTVVVVIASSEEEKHLRRKHDEAHKPLRAYREEELQQMWLKFFGADQSYHQARKNFVYKGLLPARDRALLDGTHQYTDAERHNTGGHVELVAGHVTGWHDSGQSTRDGYDA